MKKSFVKLLFAFFLITVFAFNTFATVIYSPGANNSNESNEPFGPSASDTELTPLSNPTNSLSQEAINQISQVVVNQNAVLEGGPMMDVEFAGPTKPGVTIDNSVSTTAPLNTNASINAPGMVTDVSSTDTLLSSNYQQANVSTSVPNISAPAYIVINATTKQIYASKDQDAKYEPAGLTNLMTAYLGTSFKNLNDTLTCSYNAWHSVAADAYIAGLTSGDKITLKDAIASMFVRSCADSANVIAEAISEKISTFVDAMNVTAKAIGCQNTNFTNTSGLNDENQFSTAYDLALIMDKVTENPDLVNLLSLTQYTLPETQKRDKLILFSKNSALISNGAHYNADLTCSRLGYTSSSGYTMASMCNYQGNRLIAIVLKAKGSQFEDTKKLINFAKLCYEETK